MTKEQVNEKAASRHRYFEIAYALEGDQKAIRFDTIEEEETRSVTRPRLPVTPCITSTGLPLTRFPTIAR
jgi:hypothetical protein